MFTSKREAKAYANLDSDRKVEEFEPKKIETGSYVNVWYDPSTNLITTICTGDDSHDDTYTVFKSFCFSVSLSGNLRKDIEEHGKDSPLLYKIAQDRWAQYKAHVTLEEPEPDPIPVLSPEEMAKKFFIVASIHNYALEEAMKQNAKG